ncbi:MAG TPA: FAD-dependent oxidoreductase, partial [Armatimonadota bacterium]|nr:FAD-dependent oxidoreductase [Armatimonadota bacterium]
MHSTRSLALTLVALLGAPPAASAASRAARPRRPARPPKKAPRAAVRPRKSPPRRVLDIERLQAVPVGKYPNSIPTCDVLVIGGGLGGVAAAEALARQGVTVILTEPTSMLGGQLTAQA